MEIKNLMTFVEVAELGSFTRAAEALSYSQSTVSFQIKQLETELDCLLFERINHTILLTEKGKQLLDYAREILHLTESFHENCGNVKETRGFLRIAAPDSVCEDMINSNYNDFHMHYPGISLKFCNADTLEMCRMLDHNEVDLIVTLDRQTFRHDYVIAKEEPVPMRFVTGASSPYATKKPLTLEEISEMPFILTEKGMGYRRVLDETLARHALEITPFLELGRTDIIVSVLSSGVGVSFLPEFVCEDAVKHGALTYLNVPEPKIEIWKQLIHHRNKWMSKSLSALISYIKVMEFGRRNAQ